ncbi:hypothetical protein L2E82_01504 [Cichorium intybus]|uniref:Uncharacterized protein n=1 Tax=Cichorium intybus TaxID=13427 RepID=A0ACB9H068_CICIN|nr:hypothetical protein L2E82_01504 [Cichorium intybus]
MFTSPLYSVSFSHHVVYSDPVNQLDASVSRVGGEGFVEHVSCEVFGDSAKKSLDGNLGNFGPSDNLILGSGNIGLSCEASIGEESSYGPCGLQSNCLRDLNIGVGLNSYNSLGYSIASGKEVSSGGGSSFRKKASSSRRPSHSICFKDVALAAHGRLNRVRSQGSRDNLKSCDASSDSISMSSCDRDLEKTLELGGKTWISVERFSFFS